MGLSEILVPILTALFTALSSLAPGVVPAGVQGAADGVVGAGEVPTQAWPVPLSACVMQVSDQGYTNGGPTNRYDHTSYARMQNMEAGIYPRIASKDGRQFLAFIATGARLAVADRALGATAWHVVLTPYHLQARPNDYHAGPSIGIDNDGYLYVAFDHHYSPLRYIRSASPLDTSAWVPHTSFDGVKESRVTYVHFLHSGGHLFAVYRSGGSPDADLMLKEYAEGNQTWWTVADAFLHGDVAGAQRYGAYWSLEDDPADDTLHLTWTWNQGAFENSRDLSYASSPGDHSRWYNATGALLPAQMMHNQSAGAVVVPGPLIAPQVGTSQLAYAGGAVYRLDAFQSLNATAELRLVKIDGAQVTQTPVAGGVLGVNGVVASLLQDGDVFYAIYQDSAGMLMVGRSEAPYDAWEWRPIVVQVPDIAGQITWDVDQAVWEHGHDLSLYAVAYRASPYLDRSDLQADPAGWVHATDPQHLSQNRIGIDASPDILAIDVPDVPGQFAAGHALPALPPAPDTSCVTVPHA